MTTGRDGEVNDLLRHPYILSPALGRRSVSEVLPHSVRTQTHGRRETQPQVPSFPVLHVYHVRCTLAHMINKYHKQLKVGC